MSDKTKLAVIFGGASSEYGVSLKSAHSVLNNLNCEKYEIIKIGITRDGRWYHYTGDNEKILDGTWTQSNNNSCMFSPDTSVKSLIVIERDKIRNIAVDVVFPVLHGKNGEDGTIQGLLEMAGIPFVGCKMTASAACMDKGITNTLLESADIKKAKFVAFSVNDSESAIEEIEKKIAYPVFIKPANAGSSIGISKAHNRDELIESIRLASVHDQKLVAEETVIGKEVECAVMGNEDPIASVVGEIEPCNDFYDYEAKYDMESNLYIPARIDGKTAEKIRREAIKAYKVMGCKGFSRIDFFVCENNDVVLNEINTIPGFTSISMFPKLFEASGISYPLLLDGLIELACL